MAIAHFYYRSRLSLSLCYQLFFVDMMKHLNPHCISNMYPYTTDKCTPQQRNCPFSREKLLQKTTINQNAEKKWSCSTQLHHNLYLRLREHCGRASGKNVRVRGPGHTQHSSTRGHSITTATTQDGKQYKANCITICSTSEIN